MREESSRLREDAELSIRKSDLADGVVESSSAVVAFLGHGGLASVAGSIDHGLTE
eukprot:TRINITY_DN143_c0_g1_i5.p2 TRINITY_DN143_c0_g1~~TRINITY_DN143_c0_g1_i5.p2  ORF type:complete len:55 (-),score=9.81 TRINITY_DN143_c0_g1_i5:25-189(-)